MKVIKENHQPVLFNAIELGGRYVLTVTGFIFFDLDQPDIPLKEKEMWDCVKTQIGPGQSLDQSFPKPAGEFLVFGDACAPKGEPCQGVEVTVRVGGNRKSLLVFGDRFWEGSFGAQFWDGTHGVPVRRPFTRMPLRWENAFGGPGFEKNPLGKGVVPVPTGDGHVLQPFPNIEDPHRLIKSREDRPDPAGFGPYALNWPQRLQKAGTYDDKWKRERWPFFPEDFQTSFFNTAPPDQRIEGFYSGDETFEISNMHPERPLIQSRWPRLRPRLFITQRTGKSPDETAFRELTVRRDTVWLFPTAMRGLVCFRGTAAVADDEFSDVTRLFAATEKSDEAPRPIEHYLDEQNRRLDRSVRQDQSKAGEAKQKVAAALDQVNKIPEQLEAAKARAFGLSPAGPPTTPAEKMAGAQANLAISAGRMERFKAKAESVRSKFGHLLKLDLKGLEKASAATAGTGAVLAAVQAKAEQGAAEVKAGTDGLNADFIKEAEALKAGGTEVDVQGILEGPPEVRWNRSAFRFAARCRRNLEMSPEKTAAMSDLGLTAAAVREAYLGYNPDECLMDAGDWGLPQNDGRDAKPLAIPAGWVIPVFQGSSVAALKVRPVRPESREGEFLAPGSDPDESFVLGFGDERPLVLVNDECDAALIRQEAGSLVTVAAVPEPSQKPAGRAAELVAKAPVLLVVLPSPGSQAPEAKEIWLKQFPKASFLALPSGSRPIEAHRAGVDLKRLILEALPKPPALMEEIEANEGADKKAETPAIPKFDIKGIIAGFMAEAAKVRDAAKMSVEAEKKALLDELRPRLAKVGIEPESLLTGTVSDGSHDFDMADALKALAGERQALQAKNALTPEVDRKLNELEENAKRLSRESAQRHEAGLAKEAAARKKAENPIPDGMKDRMGKMGLDPLTGRQFTREGIVARHAAGMSLAGLNLAGLDMSGLDLSGADLSKSICVKTRFAGSNLRGARLTGLAAMEADFSKADLRDVRMEKGAFMKAGFTEADLTGAVLEKAVFRESDLSQARFGAARMSFCTFDQAKLSSADFSGAAVNRCLFNRSEIEGVNFSGADLSRSVFMKMSLNGADFTGCRAEKAAFITVTGEKIPFAGARLANARFIRDTRLPRADFKNTDLAKAAFMDSDFSGADFRNSRLEKSLVQGCGLKDANLNRASARNTRLTKCDLSGANLKGLNLFQGSLRKSKLTETDLSGGNLFGVDFYKAVFGRTNLDGALIKNTLLDDKTDLLK